MPHEWCREHVVRHISVIIPTYALRHIQTAARTRKGYVELARVLGEHLRIGATVEVGHASVYGVEHYHVVELQALRRWLPDPSWFRYRRSRWFGGLARDAHQKCAAGSWMRALRRS